MIGSSWSLPLTRTVPPGEVDVRGKAARSRRDVARDHGQPSGSTNSSTPPRPWPAVSISSGKGRLKTGGRRLEDGVEHRLGLRREATCTRHQHQREARILSLIHISEPTRLGMISYAVFCLKKKN